ncbi:MAG: patatin-like phospholipase family protein [Clostridia bacterium]|nr:patatin-like phospholipase family protein [Clostridia bacterium]
MHKKIYNKYIFNGDIYESRFSFISGGGVKGAAHIGVIRAFEEENIKIDYISGTSSGSIVASLYAMRI